MAKLTPTQIENELASSTGLAVDDTRRLLSELAALAYEHATDGFLLPGFGQFTVSPDEKLYRQPGTGEMILGHYASSFTQIQPRWISSLARRLLKPSIQRRAL